MDPAHVLDKYAPKYVPQWQRPYEHSVHETVIPFTSSQLVDWNLYAGVLYPAPLLMRLAKRDWDNREDCKRNWSLANSPSPATSDAPNGHSIGANGTPWSPPSRLVPTIHLPTSYATHWNILLSKEYESRSLSLLKSGLYEVQLLPLPPMPETPDVSLFLLNVPSIRENYPPVSMNDTVFIRQLRPHNQTFQGLAFEARVYTVQRLAGTIVLRCDPLSHHWESGLFNVAWIPQQRHFTACHRALECIHAHLPKTPGVSVTSSNPIRPCATAWIFPEHSDLHLGEVNGMKQPPKMRPPHITWKDNDLNSEQKFAVQSIVHGSHKIPYLISGPPGTGKTKTIVEAVLQILASHRHTHILVCGVSNSSADTLTTRLAKSLGIETLFRLNDPSRPVDDVRQTLRPWCHIDNGIWALPPMHVLLSKRVIVTTCIDASLLYSARCTNAALAQLEDHIASHLYTSRSTPAPAHHFGFLLVDEAGQATEPELCVPLSVVLPHTTTSLAPPQITICGDPHQLGPLIESDECRNNDMDVSLLERLFKRSVYSDHPLSRSNIRRKRGIHEVVTDVDDVDVPFCNLTRNYRSHRAILMLPSTLFYDDTLIPCASPAVQYTPLARWPALGPTPNFPFLFIGKSSPEEWTDERRSFFNSGEIEEVTRIVVGLLGHQHGLGGPYAFAEDTRPPLTPSGISIISPFREQVWKIRVALRSIGLGDVDVGDVEGLQGAENRVVIISTVRSSIRFIQEDHRLNRGIMFEAKRFTVALTRAKELLVIVGNGHVLQADPWWKSLLAFVHRNHAYRGPPIAGIDASLADAFSRLEEEWRTPSEGKGYSDGVNGNNQSNGHVNGRDADEMGMAIAGSIVRETLMEEGD